MKLLKWGAILMILATITACYPDYPTNTEDHDLVYVLRNSDVFIDDDGQTEFKTYFMPDTIIHVIDSLQDKKDPDFPRDYDELILKSVAENLEALGYQRIQEAAVDTPDVLITIAALALEKTVVYTYYPGYWWGGGYGGGYWGDYWWNYPGGYWPTYPSYSVYTFNKGTVFIDMVTFEKNEKDEDIPVGEWTAAINGLLYEGYMDTEDRLTLRIDKAFEESTFLTVKDEN